MFGRYAHLMRACRDRRRALQDSTLEARLNSMRTWNSVRFGVSVLLSIGVLATVLSTIAQFLQVGADIGFVGKLVAISSALTGLLTVVYLFLTRLLGQLEIDILAILTLDHWK